jgi:hypothetical protein
MTYLYLIAVAIYFPIGLYADAHVATVGQQDLIGLTTFTFLFVALRFSPASERRQVWVLVCLATLLECFCSLLWGVYRYRFGNVPLAVPWGHGLIYLFALRASRSPFVTAHGQGVRRVAMLCATMWAVAGVTLLPWWIGRWDLGGALLWLILIWFMLRSNTSVYAAAFFVTSALELIATSLGNWRWAVTVPLLGIPAGNPPSGIAAAYCLLDAAAFFLAASLASWRAARAQPPEKQAVTSY